MPDIGTTLRETRMRQRIDIVEVEAATKIRAKYLRALENEEWDQLPGPTFVKTFLRTYAEALGLDAKLLVEQYKLRHERLSETELRPIAPPGSRRAGGGRRGPRGGGGFRIPRWVAIAAILVALVAALFTLGKLTEDDPGATVNTADRPVTSSTTANGPQT